MWITRVPSLPSPKAHSESGTVQIRETASQLQSSIKTKKANFPVQKKKALLLFLAISRQAKDLFEYSLNHCLQSTPIYIASNTVSFKILSI